MKKNSFYFFFQTCDELGFTVSDKEWVQIRNMLENSTENLDSEMMVKSEDFFSALHTIMTNKQKNRNGISEAGSNLKVSFAIDEKFFIGFWHFPCFKSFQVKPWCPLSISMIKTCERKQGSALKRSLEKKKCQNSRLLVDVKCCWWWCRRHRDAKVPWLENIGNCENVAEFLCFDKFKCDKVVHHSFSNSWYIFLGLSGICNGLRHMFQTVSSFELKFLNFLKEKKSSKRWENYLARL